MRLRRLGLAAGLGLAFAVAGLPALAVEPPPGSKNFVPPGNVPNYFSNESSSLQGGAAVRPMPPGAPSLAAAPAARIRSAAASRAGRHQRVRAAKGRGRAVLAHARGKPVGARHVAHAAAAKGAARGGGAARVAGAGHSKVPPARTAPVAARAAPGKAVAAQNRAGGRARGGGAARVARAGR